MRRRLLISYSSARPGETPSLRTRGPAILPVGSGLRYLPPPYRPDPTPFPRRIGPLVPGGSRLFLDLWTRQNDFRTRIRSIVAGTLRLSSRLRPVREEVETR